jgi:epoxide hydrolase
MSDDIITPFRADIPETALGDLRDRLARTRWPDELLIGDIRAFFRQVR